MKGDLAHFPELGTSHIFCDVRCASYRKCTHLVNNIGKKRYLQLAHSVPNCAPKSADPDVQCALHNHMVQFDLRKDMYKGLTACAGG